MTGLLVLLALPTACEKREGAPAPAAGPAPAAKVEAPPPAVPFPPDPAKIEDFYRHCLALVAVVRHAYPNIDKPVFDEARVHERFGHDDRAIELYQEAIGLAPQRADAHMSIGFLLSQQDRFEEAAEAYQFALAVDPGSPGAHLRLGLIHLHEGRLDAAIESYRRELERDPGDAEVHNSLGQAFLQKGEHAEARQSFERAIRIDPEHLNAHYGLSQTLRALGETEKSATTLARFQELRQEEKEAEAEAARREKENPGVKDRVHVAATYHDLAQTYRLVGAEELSLRMLRGALIFHPADSVGHFQLIERLRKAGQQERALERGLEALEHHPEDFQLLYLVAGLHSDRKNYLESGKLLHRAVLQSPRHQDALRELARTILLGGLFGPQSAPRALVFARRAVEVQESSHNLDILAWAQFAAGQREEARLSLLRAVEIDPDNPDVKRRLDQLSRSP